MFREIEARPVSGIPMALLLLLGVAGSVALLVFGARGEQPLFVAAGLLLIILLLLGTLGLLLSRPIRHGCSRCLVTTKAP